MSDAPKGIEPRFDELIHAPTRLSIVALLAAADWADFTFVRDRLKRAAANGGESIKDVERGRAERHISLVTQVDRGAVSVEDADRGERI